MLTSCSNLAAAIGSGRLDKEFSILYGKNQINREKSRYLRVIDLLEADKPGGGALFVNAPGRTELGGNHTDHNHGCVLAAAVDLDCVAAITPLETTEVTLVSEGFSQPIHIELDDLTPRAGEQGTAEALVRGMAAAVFQRTGLRGGFYGHLHATCLPGTGLSSSAAFSLVAGAAFNYLLCDNVFSAEQLAQMARDAENNFFGKPCGLMDQMASAVGSTIFIDFHQPDKPVVEALHHSLEDSGYRLALIDTGTSHTGLTPEYASIPREIHEAAAVLGHSCGRGISVDELLTSITEVREQAGDRAVLRLLHFIEENDRAQLMAKLIRKHQFSEFLQQVEASGRSSCNLLQNCATATSTREQGVLLGLAMSERICPGVVCRVHGGGFAGTVQAYVPDTEFDNYCDSMEKIFGSGTVMPIRIGRPGVCGLTGSTMIFPGQS